MCNTFDEIYEFTIPVILPSGGIKFFLHRFTQIEREGGKYGNCTEGWPDFLQLNTEFTTKWPKYDRETCLFYCLQNAMAESCGCTDSYEFNFSTNSVINRASQFYCDVTNRTESECRQSKIANNTIFPSQPPCISKKSLTNLRSNNVTASKFQTQKKLP